MFNIVRVFVLCSFLVLSIACAAKPAVAKGTPNVDSCDRCDELARLVCDLDGNGGVDASTSDYLIIIQAFRNELDPDSSEFRSADMDHNGDVTTVDWVKFVEVCPLGGN